MLCIGYGTLSAPVSVTEVWLTTISMTLGASLFAAIIGSITALFLPRAASSETGRSRKMDHPVERGGSMPEETWPSAV
jgi:hypothetical protein